MDLKDPNVYKNYLERTIQLTEEFAIRQMERQFTYEGICHTLGKLSKVLYLGTIISILPASYFEISKIVSEDRKARKLDLERISQEDFVRE